MLLEKILPTQVIYMWRVTSETVSFMISVTCCGQMLAAFTSSEPGQLAFIDVNLNSLLYRIILENTISLWPQAWILLKDVNVKRSVHV